MSIVSEVCTVHPPARYCAYVLRLIKKNYTIGSSAQFQRICSLATATTLASAFKGERLAFGQKYHHFMARFKTH